MKRVLGWTALVGTFVMVLAVLTSAQQQTQPPAGGPGGGRGMGMGMGMGQRGPGRGPMAALKLTDEQRQKLQTLMQSQRESHQAVMKQVQELRTQLRQAIYGAGDASTAADLSTQIASIEAKARIEMQIAAAQILTDEQKKVVIESGIDFLPGMGPGGPGRGGPGGPDGQGGPGGRGARQGQTIKH